MHIFPAIDLYDKKAVRLYKGDYAQMTVYSENPLSVAQDFVQAGCNHIHIVDLEGAKTGQTPNLPVIKQIIGAVDAFVEVGGGIRTIETVETYINAGVDRVILGTAAVQNPEFLQACVDNYGDKIAVGIDIKDGYVAIKGWMEKSAYTADEFFAYLEKIGVSTVICTDISKDGAMQGTNRALYEKLSRTYSMQIIASGGVSDLTDIQALRALNLYGAIIGKAYYTGAIDLRQAVEVSK